MPSTILAGVILLWSEGSYPVAAVIFLARIMVPTLKMIAIAWLCWDAKGHGKRDSERMHLLYEVVALSLIHILKNCDQTGGLSGRPLQLKSTEIIRRLSQELNGRLPIIGVGGIDSVIAAREKIAAGASLVQIYSGFIFKGPPLIKEIVTHI